MKAAPKSRVGQRCEPPGLVGDDELARRMGLSPVRVWQLRMRAYAKLRAMVLEDPELREAAAELCGVATEKLATLKGK